MSVENQQLCHHEVEMSSVQVSPEAFLSDSVNGVVFLSTGAIGCTEED